MAIFKGDTANQFIEGMGNPVWGGVMGSTLKPIVSGLVGKKDERWASDPAGGDKYYQNYISASIGANLGAWTGGKLKNKAYILAMEADLQNQRKKQAAEMDALRNRTKTVNYGSSISNPMNPEGTEDGRDPLISALDEEEELLGKRMGKLGSNTLGGL